MTGNSLNHDNLKFDMFYLLIEYLVSLLEFPDKLEEVP